MAKIYLKCEDPVQVTCYGQTKTWERKDAINFFLEGMMSSDGSERERYANIYCQLVAGYKIVSDEF